MVPEPGHLWERQSLLLKGLSLSPDNAELNMREAELLAEAGRFHEALAYGRRAASLDPLDPVLAFELSGYLVYEGRLAEARSMIDKAARLWPDDEYVRITRISTEARYGDPDRALALIADPSSRPVSWELRTSTNGGASSTPARAAIQRSWRNMRAMNSPAWRRVKLTSDWWCCGSAAWEPSTPPSKPPRARRRPSRSTPGFCFVRPPTASGATRGSCR
jgi:hypothetical protein